MRNGLGEIHIGYTVDLPHGGTNRALILANHQNLVRILGIVTAFTIGHHHAQPRSAGPCSSPRVTHRGADRGIYFGLGCAAFRPICSGREAWIAAFFGLIHGLAFAATLDRLRLERWERVTGILAFNLGIETMQMLVVVTILRR